MCGRLVVVEPDLSVFVAPYGANLVVGEPWQPRYNLAPTQRSPVITSEAARRLDLLRFGAVVRWAPSATTGRMLINARVETVATLRSFREALALRRCIVPVNGYYEWQVQRELKRPHYIHNTEGAPIALAGIWQRWATRQGEPQEGFVLITRPARGFLSDIHDRMPLTVSPSLIDCWLDPRERDANDLAPVLTAAPQFEGWTAHEVAPIVNKPSNDSPECLSPYSAPPSPLDRQLELFASPAGLPHVGPPRS